MMVAMLTASPVAAEAPPKPGPAAEPCTLKAGATHTVVAVVDPETLELDDGSQVRLAGILAPSPPAFLSAGAVWRPDAEARSALKQLLLGETVELAYADPRRDRWGRHLAHVFKTGTVGREWVQGIMLREGHARVDPLPDDMSCVSELLAHERPAMTAERGLWSNPAYRIRWADLPPRLMRLRNTFQLVEGRVHKVALTRGRIYVNFGADWRSDFTAGARRAASAFDRNAIARLQAFEGRRVRVRGWIERRNGPYIELAHPLQIEAVSEESLPPSAGVARGVIPPGSGDDEARVPAGAVPDAEAEKNNDADADKKKRPEHEIPDALDL